MTGYAIAVPDAFRKRLRDPAQWSLTADIVAVLIALSLPWSTSLVSIFTVIWVIAVVPTLDIDEFLQSLKKPIAALPITFFSLAIVAMLWSDAAWSARVHSAGQTAKFLLIPLLIYHYQRSTRGPWVFVAFVASCTLLMVLSFATVLDPAVAAFNPEAKPGVPVKNYIDQSQSFSLCAVALGYPIVRLLKERRLFVAALIATLAALFVGDLVFAVTSRTALVSLPLLLLLLAFSLFGWRGGVASLATVAIVGVLFWTASPKLRVKLASMYTEYSEYQSANEATSVGLRLEFWRKSVGFLQTAPLVGHGTGSTEGQFSRAAVGAPAGSAAAQVIRNPHNQTLAAAVQWGLLGIGVLWMLWIVHLLWMMRGTTVMASIGVLVVSQSIVTSLFNSHLFDFHPGWMYVLGVGITAGSVQRARTSSLQSHKLTPGVVSD